MKNERDKIELLLEHNADEQLKKVDWDELNSAISTKLDEAQKDKASVRKHPIVFKIAAGIAATAAVILVTLVIYSKVLPSESQSILKQIETGALNTGQLGSRVDETDGLLASTDPKMILLTGELHLISNDPLLAPHSVWDQEPVLKLTSNNDKEKI